LALRAEMIPSRQPRNEPMLLIVTKIWFLPRIAVLRPNNHKRLDNLGKAGNLDCLMLASGDDFGYNKLVNKWGLGGAFTFQHSCID
jgi:hypothetical protein